MTALPILQARRDCNGCAECCHTMSVVRADGTRKPCNVWCENVVGDGKRRACSIYETRWQPCQDFVCAWAAGIIPEELWPGRTRCIVSFEADGTAFTVYEHKDRPRSSLTGAMGKFIDLITRNGISVTRVCGEHRSVLIRK